MNLRRNVTLQGGTAGSIAESQSGSFSAWVTVCVKFHTFSPCPMGSPVSSYKHDSRWMVCMVQQAKQ